MKWGTNEVRPLRCSQTNGRISRESVLPTSAEQNYFQNLDHILLPSQLIIRSKHVKQVCFFEDRTTAVSIIGHNATHFAHNRPT